VATSLGKEEATATQVLGLYRMRRQIEPAFKRLKSLFAHGVNHQEMQSLRERAIMFYNNVLLVYSGSGGAEFLEPFLPLSNSLYYMVILSKKRSSI